MLNTLKHLSRSSMQYIFGTMGGTIIYSLVFRVLFGGGEESGGFVLGSIFGLSVMLCFAGMVSYYSNYCSMAMSMGATRKNFFAAIQVIKVANAVGFFITMIISGFLVPALYGGENIYSLNDLALLASATIFFCSMGECIGVMCMRFGKVGIYIYISVCALFGGVLGFTAVMSSDNQGGGITALIAGLPAIAILAGVLLIAVILSFVNWVLFKKTDVKGV